MLDSIPAPAGEMTVVLAPGMGGVLFHEAVGHPLESDAIDKEASVYRGLDRQQCATELIDGVDDATIPNGWGSYAFDDEADAVAAHVAVQEGRAAGPALRPDARRQGRRQPPTGNGRRQSYASPPIPRMTNTNILNGDVDARRRPVVHRERRVRDLARRRTDRTRPPATSCSA